MKLLAKTNKQYIIFSILAYALIALIFYTVTEHVIYEEVEYRLKLEGQEFEHYVDDKGIWEESCYFVENKIELTPVKKLIPLKQFKDTLLTNRYSRESDPFRQYSFYTEINDQHYRVNIRKSLIESNKLLSFITGTMLILLSIGLSILFFLQRKMSKKLWQPFYKTLHQAKTFDISIGRGLNMPNEKTFEFNELNQVLEKMTGKIATDYQNLKEFTENAAHEIQTPLALISTRIEELVQGTNFNDKQMYWLEEIQRSTIRLSKLHQGLILLSKIDNGQFYEHEKLNLIDLMKKKVIEHAEFFELKNLNTSFKEKGKFELEMHPILADILIGNLLNNAIKHNITHGYIKIETDKNVIQVSNTGAQMDFDPSKLFERFKKQNQTSASLGLGLAIVKKICDYYNIQIRYWVTDEIHHVELSKLVIKHPPSS